MRWLYIQSGLLILLTIGKIMSSKYQTPIFLAAMVCTSALATGSHTPPPKGNSHDRTTTSSSAAQSNAIAGSKSQSAAGAAAVSGSVAAGGNADNTNVVTANGGAGGMGGQGGEGGAANQTQSATATNAGNAQSLTIQEARQTPWVILPSIFANDCGSGVNAGGSKAGGAGAFGFSWTTDKCYDFKNGVNFVAIGAVEEACVLWVDVNRKAFARQKYTPDCKAIALRVYEGQRVAQTPPQGETKPDPQYVRRDELPALLKDRDDRMLRQAVSK